MNRILIADDDPAVRESLKFALRDKYEIVTAESDSEAVELSGDIRPDLVILDMMLPKKGGMDVLKDIKVSLSDIPVIMIAPVVQPEKAAEALEAGAYGCISKPFDIEEFKMFVYNAVNSRNVQNQIRFLTEEIRYGYPVKNIVFKSGSMAKVVQRALRLSKDDSVVLLTGSVGAGKELIARYIHENSSRAKGSFVPVRCGSTDEKSFKREFAGGHVGGTAADLGKVKEKIESAEHGTVFFRAADAMPLPMQEELLGFFKKQKTSENKVVLQNSRDIRIMASLSADNEKKEEKNLFLAEFLSVFAPARIRIPSLVERREDIRDLAVFYLHFFKSRIPCRVNGFSDEALNFMLCYSWPGNVSELKNMIERILLVNGNKSIIEVEDLPQNVRCSGFLRTGFSLSREVDDFEKNLIIRALEESGWNQTKAAEKLKTTRRILRYRMQKYGLG